MTNSYMIYWIDDDYTFEKKSDTITYINKIAPFYIHNMCIKNDQSTQSALFYNISYSQK